jgi:hypothetical protein
MRKLWEAPFAAATLICLFAAVVVPGAIVLPRLLFGWSNSLLTLIVILIAPPSILLLSETSIDSVRYTAYSYCSIVIINTAFYLISVGICAALRHYMQVLLAAFLAYLSSCLLFLLVGNIYGTIDKAMR